MKDEFRQLFTPMSIMVGVGRAAQAGVLIKNAEALGSVDTYLSHKTMAARVMTAR
jgi:cation transport ATPase